GRSIVACAIECGYEAREIEDEQRDCGSNSEPRQYATAFRHPAEKIAQPFVPGGPFLLLTSHPPEYAHPLRGHEIRVRTDFVASRSDVCFEDDVGFGRFVGVCQPQWRENEPDARQQCKHGRACNQPRMVALTMAWHV